MKQFAYNSDKRAISREQMEGRIKYLHPRSRFFHLEKGYSIDLAVSSKVDYLAVFSHGNMAWGPYLDARNYRKPFLLNKFSMTNSKEKKLSFTFFG